MNESWAIHFSIFRFKYAVNGSMGFHLLYLLIFLTALQMWIRQCSPEKQNYEGEADRARGWKVWNASCRYGGRHARDVQNKAGWALRETLASQLGPRGCPETESSLPGDLTLLSLKTFSRLDETQAHGGASFIFSKSADLNVNHILKKPPSQKWLHWCLVKELVVIVQPSGHEINHHRTRNWHTVNNTREQ